MIQLRHAGGAGSIFYATNGYLDNAPVTLELVGTSADCPTGHTDLTVTYADGAIDVTAAAQLGSGEKAYWGASHGLLIADFYRHVRIGRPFWIDAAEALQGAARPQRGLRTVARAALTPRGQSATGCPRPAGAPE